jgi:glutamyl-tRNA reductase
MKRLNVLGISYKRVDQEKLSEFHLNKMEIPELLKKIISINGVDEAMILSTCNRTEIYFVTSNRRIDNKYISNLIMKELGFYKDRSFFYHYEGKKTVRHIFKVASSLDSMVVGENEITGQFKNAFEIAVKSGTVKKILYFVFRQAMVTVKRVQEISDISKGMVSAGRTAVMEMKRIFKDFSDKKILVVGAGYMAELVLRVLTENGAKRLSISNRTYDKAKKLSEKYGSETIDFKLLNKSIAEFDAVFLATSSSKPIIYYKDLKDKLSKTYKKHYIVDISLPPNADVKIKNIKNVVLMNMDYFKKLTDKNIKIRKENLKIALSAIDDSVIKFENDFAFNEIIPLFERMKKKAIEFSESELAKTVKINKIDLKTEEAMRNYNTMLIDKLIKRHMSMIKNLMGLKKIKSSSFADMIEMLIKTYE